MEKGKRKRDSWLAGPGGVLAQQACSRARPRGQPTQLSLPAGAAWDGVVGAGPRASEGEGNGVRGETGRSGRRSLTAVLHR
jgi:hypothetical protein